MPCRQPPLAGTVFFLRGLRCQATFSLRGCSKAFPIFRQHVVTRNLNRNRLETLAKRGGMRYVIAF